MLCSQSRLQSKLLHVDVCSVWCETFLAISVLYNLPYLCYKPILLYTICCLHDLFLPYSLLDLLCVCVRLSVCVCVCVCVCVFV